MKAIIYTLSAMLLLAACKKGDNQTPVALTGTWVHTESFVSTGASGSWYPAAESPRTTVSFNSSGLLTGTAFADYKTYTVKDSVTLVLKKTDQTIQNYHYTIKDDELTMSPSGPIMCIEGCAIRFKRK